MLQVWPAHTLASPLHQSPLGATLACLLEPLSQHSSATNKDPWLLDKLTVLHRFEAYYCLSEHVWLLMHMLSIFLFMLLAC
jgi:hypothetical protein